MSAGRERKSKGRHRGWTSFHTRRWRYALAAGIVIVLGLTVRQYPDVRPVWIAEHAGDALWASMIYFSVRFCFCRQRIRAAAMLALSFCFLDEFSQLYQASWINQIRATTLGALVLGHGFLVVDLFRYTVGVGAAYVCDRLFLTDSGRQDG